MSTTIVVLGPTQVVEEARKCALRLCGHQTWKPEVNSKQVEEILTRLQNARAQGLRSKLSFEEAHLLDLSASEMSLQEFVSNLSTDLYGFSSFAVLPTSSAVPQSLLEAHGLLTTNLQMELIHNFPPHLFIAREYPSP